MIRFVLEPVLHLAVLTPFILLLLQEKSATHFRRLFSFAACYIIYQVMLMLPVLHPAFDFVKSRWNWDGKIYGILWAAMAYFLFKKLFRENDFFTLRQNSAGFKSGLTVAVAIILLSTAVWFIFGNSKLNLESLAFQASLPGIDEEMIFRGILLGLLLSSLKEHVPVLGNPGILITSVLFGFMHALTLSKDYAIRFDPLYFLQTGLAGYVWGWVTFKTRSILLAVLSHNLSNFFGTLASMLK